MRLWARIFLGYFLVVGIAGWFVLRVFIAEVKPGVREAVEDVMVDSANLVAEMAAAELKSGHLKQERFARMVEEYRRRQINVTIWGRTKQSLDFRIYVTDVKGIVRFDSDGEVLGQDYSQWRDVARTLKGEYGARSTRDDPEDDASSVLYVAAPVMDGAQIIGVATIAKPASALAPIIARSERSVFRHGMLLLASTLFIGGVFTLWLTLSFGRLVSYARALARGEKAVPPSRGKDEIGELSRALAGMRAELDGRAYVESYVEHLTHEMKSPLAAIRGAAELLAEPLPEPDRQRFAANITQQGVRLQQMIDRLLSLAQLEQQQNLQNPLPVDLARLFSALDDQFAVSAALRGVIIQWRSFPGAIVSGDEFLLTQAVANLVENALAFSVRGGRVDCLVEHRGNEWLIKVSDQGSGIPTYAMERAFERFFSLPRPDGAPKSTGLGLAFVREVAKLHGGEISLANHADGGVVATLRLPA